MGTAGCGDDFNYRYSGSLAGLGGGRGGEFRCPRQVCITQVSLGQEWGRYEGEGGGGCSGTCAMLKACFVLEEYLLIATKNEQIAVI